jgi:hypothetical protein
VCDVSSFDKSLREALTIKDKIALSSGILLGAIFGILAFLAGYGFLVVGGFHGIVILPIILVFIADTGEIVIWQLSVLSFALSTALSLVVADASLSGSTKGDAITVFFLFWAMESVISSPVPAFLYWKGSKKRRSYRFEWLFLGIVFAGLVGVLWRNPFLFACLALLWCAICSILFAWDWRTATAPAVARRATLVALSVLILALLGLASSAIGSKQQIFRSAMDHHYYRIARLLVAIGADVDSRNQFGQTALMTAAVNGVGDLDGVNVLLSMGADVNRVGSGGFSGLLPGGTALHFAAASGRTEICESLLKAGADVNKRSEKGVTPLTAALSGSSLNCVPVLSQHGADVNAADVNGHTPLMLLMPFGPGAPVVDGVFRELIAKGADLDAKDTSGKTAEDWAIYYKHERFAEQLRLARQLRGTNH